MRHYFAVFFLVILLVIPWFAWNYPNQIVFVADKVGNISEMLVATVLNHKPKTADELKSRYSAASPTIFSSITNNQHKRVRILLVPGHEPSYGGAEFGSLKERELVMELANNLKGFIDQNDKYQVFITRDGNSWNPTFANYFKDYWSDIAAWQKANKAEVRNLTKIDRTKTVVPEVIHNSVPNDVAMRLYGISKWANENDIDIAIHIHLNDDTRHGRSVSGEYSGFTIYVPEKQYANSTTTHLLADTIFKRLQKYSAVSDLPGESSGIVQDRDLIAIGAYNSMNAPSMLIEYGYLYEPQFVNENIRSVILKDLAYQTYLGLQDFFDAKNITNVTGSADTFVLPHVWNKDLSEKNSSVSDIFALQTALLLEGVYPPSGKSKNDCPRTGMIGVCTKAALSAFQIKYGIDGENGKLGPKTIETMRQLYSVKAI